MMEPEQEIYSNYFDKGTECVYIYIYYSFRYIWLFKNAQGIFCHAIVLHYF